MKVQLQKLFWLWKHIWHNILVFINFIMVSKQNSGLNPTPEINGKLSRSLFDFQNIWQNIFSLHFVIGGLFSVYNYSGISRFCFNFWSTALNSPDRWIPFPITACVIFDINKRQLAKHFHFYQKYIRHKTSNLKEKV